MNIYLIAQDSLDALTDILKRIPNRTKEEHAIVKRLGGIIESIEDNPACWSCKRRTLDDDDDE